MKNFIALFLIFAALAGYSQKATNTWNGNFNSYWHNNANWSLGHIPLSSEDVVIPNGMLRYPSVDFYDEAINSLTIQSNAEVRVYDHIFEITGDVTIYGELKILHEDARLECNNISWESGSEAQTTGNCDIMVFGNWEFKAGANVQLEEGRAWFYGSNNQYIRSKEADCYFNDVYVQKDAGVFALSGQSSASCKIKGYLTLAGANYDVLSYANETIQIGKYFQNSNPNINLAIDNGTIEITDYPSNFMFKPQAGDYINNLIVNTGSYDFDLSTTYTTTFEIKGDVTINSGQLDANGMDLLVGGDWENNVGLSGFVERDEKVTFNGSGHQYCSDETFYTLEINKPSGALRMQGSDVVCAEYDWTDGAIDVLSGSFTANELLDAGIAGEWYVNDEVHIHQNVGYIDLLGDLHIFDGGYMHVYGGSGDSWWPYGASGSHFEIESGGALKFHDVGINIRPTGTLTTNINGGWVGMAGNFKVDRADFSAPSLVWGMQGIADASLEIDQGYIYQVDVAKIDSKTNAENLNNYKNIPGRTPESTTISNPEKYYNNNYVSKGIYTTGFTARDGKVYTPKRSNTVSVAGNLNVNHMHIYAGTFDINGHTANLPGEMFIFNGGILKMTNPLDELNLRDLEWRSGSADLITKGEINVSGNWTFETGTESHLGSDNTVRFVGGGLSSIYNYDEDAFFGSIALQKNSGSSVYLDELNTHAIYCVGDFSIENNNNLYPQSETLIVDGTLDIQYGSAIYLEDAGGQLINNSDMNLTGKIEVLDGCEALIDGDFDIATSGELIIGGGEFIVENGSPVGNDVYGVLTISDGLFQIDHSINIESTAVTNISGGMIRSGAFLAEYAGTFEPTGGIVEIQTNNGSFGHVKCSNGNFFNDLNVNRAGSPGGAILKTNTLIVNDLNILLGHLAFDGNTGTVNGSTTIFDGGLTMTDAADVLNAGDDPSDEILWSSDASFFKNEMGRINIFGHCTVEDGVTNNIEADQTIAFVGSGAQNLYNYDDATYGTIELAKPSGELIIPAGSNVTCQSYDWTSGTFTLDGGHFTTNDLLQNGLFGTYNFNSGEAYFIQDEIQYPDINANINLLNASVTIEGGGYTCAWGWSDDVVFNMSGGEFNFIDNGIFIDPPSYTITENITGGIIRTNGNFKSLDPEFTPTGGTLELIGNTLAEVSTPEGNLYNLVINKVESDYVMPQLKSRKGEIIQPIDATMVNLDEDLLIMGTTTIESGELATMGYNMTCYGDVEVNDGGTFIVNPSSQLSMDDNEEINVNSGGMLEVAGEAGNEVVFTHITGNYDLNINAGGTISGSHTLFEYIGSSGLNVGLDAIIDPASPLNNCTFRYGEAGGTLFTVNNSQTVTIDGAEFYTNGTENYNVKKGVNAGEITFTNFSGDFAGAAYEEDPYNRINWFEPALSVSPSSLNVSAAAGTVTFSVTSNTTWTVSEGLDWLNVTPVSGNGNETLTVNYDENISGMDRTGEITVSTERKLAVVVTVSQEGELPLLSVDPDHFDFLAPFGINFLNVYSNTNWTITDNMDWLGLNLEFPSGNQVVQVSVDMNLTGAVRSGEITLETEDGSIEIIIPVTQQYFVEHTISLPAGWSGLSSYAIPTPPFIDDVFSGISDELIIALTGEEIYYPEYGINTIDRWDDFSAYKIKTNVAVDLEIYGSSYPEKTMDLPAGWSMLPVISECPVAVEDLFAPLVSDIEIVKDIAGYGIYWPAMGINTLGTLNPGKAYYVLTNAAIEITFDDCGKSASGTLTVPHTQETLPGLSPWKIAKPSASSHSIALLPSAIQNLEKGSIIGAFDMQGNCFGVTVINGNADVITVFGDDELSSEKDGFNTEDQIIFKLYQPSTKEEIELVPEFDFTLPDAEGVFVENGLSAITAFKADNTGIAGQSMENIRIYPNPSNGTFNISGIHEGAVISITDVHGQLVFSGQSNADILQTIDIQNCIPGIYMIKINQQENLSYHKMLVR